MVLCLLEMTAKHSDFVDLNVINISKLNITQEKWNGQKLIEKSTEKKCLMILLFNLRDKEIHLLNITENLCKIQYRLWLGLEKLEEEENKDFGKTGKVL